MPVLKNSSRRPAMRACRSERVRGARRGHARSLARAMHATAVSYSSTAACISTYYSAAVYSVVYIYISRLSAVYMYLYIADYILARSL